MTNMPFCLPLLVCLFVCLLALKARQRGEVADAPALVKPSVLR